jgi:hypothetical protein
VHEATELIGVAVNKCRRSQPSSSDDFLFSRPHVPSLGQVFEGGRSRPCAARIYDLRSTFASNALAAGVTVFEFARVMGTSVRMIERHYGALLDGAHNVIASRLDAFEAELATAADAET